MLIDLLKIKVIIRYIKGNRNSISFLYSIISFYNLFYIQYIRGGILEISVSDFLKVVNPHVIDIRSREKFNDNHIPGAINVNASMLMNNPEKYLNPSLTYYIYCQKGSSSKTLTQVLNVKGYRAFNIIGGYEAWLLSY